MVLIIYLQFQDKVDPRVKDAIESVLRNENNALDTSFEGHGVLIVAKKTVHDNIPLCLGLGEDMLQVRNFISNDIWNVLTEFVL